MLLGDKVNFIGTAEDLCRIYLDDVPVLELQNMEIVTIDEHTYDVGLSITTEEGYIFPENLLVVMYD